MNHFIVVLLSMIIILTFTKYLITETPNTENQDITLNFDSNKIKCKCNLDNVEDSVRENFANFEKEFTPRQPIENENLIVSVANLEEPKHTNVTAEKFFSDKFSYPIVPLKINNYEVYPHNQYEYMISNDNNLINNI